MAAYSGAMSEERKLILKRNFQNIVTNLIDIENVLGILLQNEIISTNFYEIVMSKPTRSNQIRELMMNLHRFGDIAYYGFLVALEQTNQKPIALQLDPNYRGQDEVDSDMAEISNIESYKLEDLEIKSLLPAQIHRVISDRNNYTINPPLESSDGKVGRVVVINNREFDVLDTREGSEVDVELIVGCFERLKFEVVVHHDLKAEDILSTLMKESFELNESNVPVNIFILFLMSHGAQDYVYGTNGFQNRDMVSIEKIQEMFDSENCPALAQKPKLFFIQACQQDKVVPKSEDIQNIEWRKVKPKLRDSQMKLQHKASDIFSMISTVPGYLSWRCPERGSFFMRTIVYVISTKCHEFDLLSMMTEAQRLLTGIEIMTASGPVIQQPDLKSRLRKKLYFLP